MRITVKVRIEKFHDELAISILSQDICKIPNGTGRQFEQLERLMFAMLNGVGRKTELYLDVNTNLPTDSVPEIVQSMVLHVNSLLTHFIQIHGPQMENATTFDRICYYYNSKGWLL